MPFRLVFLCLCVPFAVSALSNGSAESSKKVSDFTLKDSAGKPWSLAELKDAKAVVVYFLGTQCPINNAYMPRLSELHKEFEAKGVAFIALNPNQQDSVQAIADHAKKHKIPFPVLKDDGAAIADRFGAIRTPTAFVLDGERAIRYQGRIDDQFGIDYERQQPKQRYLADALTALLDGKEVATSTTEVAGCLIGRAVKPKSDGPITFTKDVVSILQRNCQECHRSGQIGPMPLMDYDDLTAWSGMVAEVVKDNRMPPWPADPKHGTFANTRLMPKEDRNTLLSWIEQGCAKGDAKDMPAAKTFTGAEGWRMGKPDQVIAMKEPFLVPAKAPKGGVPYMYFVLPQTFEEDRWVEACELKPGSKAVVHHIIAYIKEPGQFRQNREDRIGDHLLCVWAPGDLPFVYKPGVAKKIPKGSSIIFQMHYTPNGMEQEDCSSLAMIFSKEPAKYEARTRSIVQGRFTIPPGDPSHKVISESTFAEDSVLVSLFPHMHLRGKSFQYEIIFPDGKREMLLSVPRWDFKWQNMYRLEKPINMPAGTKIECTAHFDNSPGNPNNPDPTKSVRWGDQTWEEMMIGFVDYYYTKPRETKKESGEKKDGVK